MIPQHRVPTHPGEVLREEFLGVLRAGASKAVFEEP